jgi:hypothetical protein
MAAIVLTDVSVTINSVALSGKATNVVITYEKEAVEVTAFGDNSRNFVGGLGNMTCDVTLNQDFAASSVEATIFPLVGTTTTVEFKPTSGAVSATNPSYTIAGAYLASHTPINGAVGELSTTELSFQGGTLTKATS